MKQDEPIIVGDNCLFKLFLDRVYYELFDLSSVFNQENRKKSNLVLYELFIFVLEHFYDLFDLLGFHAFLKRSQCKE